MRGPRLLLVLLLLTAFTLTALDVRSGEGSPFDALRRGADAVLGPAQRAVGGAARGVGGLFDGIEPGQTVVAGDGLVGRTLRVGPFTATVLLLTDPGFTVGARLTREGTIGLATGDGEGLAYSLVEGGRIAQGDALLTTGSDTFVPGVPVGRVTSVDPDAGALVTTATVEPFVDVSSLDLVGVVTEPPRGTPRVPLEPSPR